MSKSWRYHAIKLWLYYRLYHGRYYGLYHGLCILEGILKQGSHPIPARISLLSILPKTAPVKTLLNPLLRIRHRGPDWSGVRVHNQAILCHERLAIVGVDSGAQPLTNHDDSLILCVNGEIYNHLALRRLVREKRASEGRPEPIFKTGSDCEVLLHLASSSYRLDMLSDRSSRCFCFYLCTSWIPSKSIPHSFWSSMKSMEWTWWSGWRECMPLFSTILHKAS
jgi:hypothetical protein